MTYYLSEEELEDAIGPDLAAQLLSVFGGGNLYVPAAPAPDHSIAKAIGLDGERSLCEFMSTGRGGLYVELPLGKAGALRSVQERVREALKDPSRSTKDIVRQFGVCSRTVRRIRNRLRASGDLAPYVQHSHRSQVARASCTRVPEPTMLAAWEAARDSAPDLAQPRRAGLSLGVSGLVIVNAWRRITEAAGGSLHQPSAGGYDGQANRCLLALLSDRALSDAQIAASLMMRKSTIACMRAHLTELS